MFSFLLINLLKLVSKLQKNAATTINRFPYKIGSNTIFCKFPVLKNIAPIEINKKPKISFKFILSFKKRPQLQL